MDEPERRGEQRDARSGASLAETVAGYVPNFDQGLTYLLRAPAHIRRMTSPVFRLRHFVQFRLERLILRGAIARVFVIAVAIALVAVAGGVLAYYLTGAFENPYASTWWAFLRITDPGYLGDDEGTWLRVISVTMTVGGLVLLIGALIAIMTQWLNQTIAQLEQGLTPIVMKNHVLVLGWNDRTPAIVEQLLSSEGRVKRFLDAIGGRKLKVVILSEAIGPVLVQELKDRLGPYWRPSQVILRSGSPVRLEHLERVDYRHASVVVLPAEKFGVHSGGDEAVIKTLTTAGTTPVGPLPPVIAEIIDPDHIRAATKAYAGHAEIIATGLMSSRVLVQTARFPGLGHVIEDLFDQEGVQIFLHELADFDGLPLAQLIECFETAVPIGVVRGSPPHFVPLLEAGAAVEPGDTVAVIGHGHESSRPHAPPGDAEAIAVGAHAAARGATRQRMLVIGWNSTVPSLLAECDGYPEAFEEVHVASLKPSAEREQMMARKGVTISRVGYAQLECDVTARADLERLDPAGYDIIMFVASDWLGSAEEADARSLLGYLMLTEILEDAGRQPHLVIEAMVEASAALFAAPGVELLITPKLQSHMLAQVALRRELNAVFEHLLGVGGAELGLLAKSALPPSEHFYGLQRALAARGAVALGIRRADGRIALSPDKRSPLDLAPEDRVVVLTMSTA